MDWESIKKVTGILFEYLPNTLKLFAVTLTFAIPVGMLVTMLKKCRFKPVSWLTNLYILIMRGTPLMLQIIAIYYAIPMLKANFSKQGTSGWFASFINGIDTRSESYMFTALCVAFVLNYAAYFAEIYRGGIESIPVGQYEAAEVLGYTKTQTFMRIILPQVIKIIMPSVTNEVITLVKDTSLAFTLAYAEVFSLAKQISASQSSFMPFLIAGVFYFAANYLVEFVMARIEKSMDYYK